MLVDDLNQGGPTNCSRWASLQFHENTGGRRKKITDIIFYV